MWRNSALDICKDEAANFDVSDKKFWAESLHRPNTSIANGLKRYPNSLDLERYFVFFCFSLSVAAKPATE